MYRECLSTPFRWEKGGVGSGKSTRVRTMPMSGGAFSSERNSSCNRGKGDTTRKAQSHNTEERGERRLAGWGRKFTEGKGKKTGTRTGKEKRKRTEGKKCGDIEKQIAKKRLLPLQEELRPGKRKPANRPPGRTDT